MKSTCPNARASIPTCAHAYRFPFKKPLLVRVGLIPLTSSLSFPIMHFFRYFSIGKEIPVPLQFKMSLVLASDHQSPDFYRTVLNELLFFFSLPQRCFQPCFIKKKITTVYYHYYYCSCCCCCCCCFCCCYSCWCCFFTFPLSASENFFSFRGSRIPLF